MCLSHLRLFLNITAEPSMSEDKRNMRTLNPLKPAAGILPTKDPSIFFSLRRLFCLQVKLMSKTQVQIQSRNVKTHRQSLWMLISFIILFFIYIWCSIDFKLAEICKIWLFRYLLRWGTSVSHQAVSIHWAMDNRAWCLKHDSEQKVMGAAVLQNSVQRCFLNTVDSR